MMMAKPKDEVREWQILFPGGRKVRARGKTPEEAARRVVKVYFGRRAWARRVAGTVGEPGGFEAIGASGRPLTVFDVTVPEVSHNVLPCGRIGTRG